jgi:type 1 glutamine amidotransferase
MLRCITIAALLLPLCLAAQQRALHFTATSGYDHNTRGVSFSMFTSIANELGTLVDDAPTAAAFNDPATLAMYNAIIFSNTSGNAILDGEQRANFEAWVANGGHVLGIHAASDTYRHSSANGNNTGTWDFYAELIGASVQEGPNHVSGTPAYELSHLGAHPSTTNLPDPWLKNEEYYYWEGGYYGPQNNAVLRVEETVGPNGMVNSYDAERPMSWYRNLPSGSRVFYTALGHAQSNYTGDELFRTHMRDALLWLLGGTTMIAQEAIEARILPNPTSNTLHFSMPHFQPGMAHFFDATGRMVLSQPLRSADQQLDVSSLRPGSYVLRLDRGLYARVLIMR